jgi:hypothetical protein
VRREFYPEGREREKDCGINLLFVSGNGWWVFYLIF